MNNPALTTLPEDVIDQAIEWSVRMTFNPPDDATRRTFEIWLAAAESHRLAWARIQTIGGRLTGVPADLARRTLEKLPEARLQRRKMLKLLSMITAVGVTGWTTRQATPWQLPLADFSTRVGEHRKFTLADGSLLELNTDSAVRVRFDERIRIIDLLRGEMFLTSRLDQSAFSQRPLQVTTSFGLFDTSQASFNARLNTECCRLAVTAGSVRMQPQSGNGATARTGEVWALSSSDAQRLPGNAKDLSTWRDAVLTARAMPLADVLSELGRYRNGYLGCAPDIAQRPVSGNFNLADTDKTLIFLAQAHGLRLHSMTRYWVRLSA